MPSLLGNSTSLSYRDARYPAAIDGEYEEFTGDNPYPYPPTTYSGSGVGLSSNPPQPPGTGSGIGIGTGISGVGVTDQDDIKLVSTGREGVEQKGYGDHVDSRERELKETVDVSSSSSKRSLFKRMR